MNLRVSENVIFVKLKYTPFSKNQQARMLLV
jgi:hypothetical protein